MQPVSQEFYRIQKLPPYVFAVINEMKAKARAAGLDVVDMGMGNPDGATPRAVVSKLVEADAMAGADPADTFCRVRDLAAGRKPNGVVHQLPRDRIRAPRLSEPWFC